MIKSEKVYDINDYNAFIFLLFCFFCDLPSFMMYFNLFELKVNKPYQFNLLRHLMSLN